MLSLNALLIPPCKTGSCYSFQTDNSRSVEQVTKGVTPASAARDLGQAASPPHYSNFLLSEMITTRLKGDNTVS